MEAVPKIPLISFEMKACPENTNFGPKLKQYISEAYREDPDTYNNEIHQLESLRSAAIRSTSDAAGLAALIKYFCQLRSIQSRFPMGKGQPVACTFVWRELFSNTINSVADIKYEIACILYNIAALHTQLGASEPRNSADSMKAACTHFQHAAYAFHHIKEMHSKHPGGDLKPEIMKLMQEICLAQAQECILEKSIQDTRKPSVVGAVASQVLVFYKHSLSHLGSSTGSDNVHEIIGTKLYNYWYRYISFKSLYIGSIVCLYQGMHAEEQQKMGERVAFYQQAADKLNEARKLAKYVEPTQITQEALAFTNDVVEGKRKAAKNENEFIYHEEVPDKDLLLDLKPVCLVKPMPMNLRNPELSGPDIFSRLVPMVTHEASSVYSEEKAVLLRRVATLVDDKNTELQEFMSSLQLDQLDMLDADQKIPQEIVDRCAAMNARSEIIQNLVESMNSLAEIISDVEHSLDEIQLTIKEETESEIEYQKVMGARPMSLVQTELARELHKYEEAHRRTRDSNQVLHKAVSLHVANLRLLALPLDQLQNKIPSIRNIEDLDVDTMNEMRRVVGKAREMQAQRDALVQQLREAVAADDVTAQLLQHQDAPAQLFKQEIQKHTPTVELIELNLAAQEKIINKLTSLYASYGESRRLLSDVLRKREGLINALITSYDTYSELLGKCQKGLEFYRKLSANVSQLLARLRSTCQVHDEERAQRLAKNKPKHKEAAAVPEVVPKSAESAPTVSVEKSGPKLKDYLPYMKNRSTRSVTPQAPAPVEAVPIDTYYPESIYPTSVRPAPVGSEATDITQMQLPDGVIAPMMNPQNLQNPYNRYPTEPDAYPSYSYPSSSKAYDKPEEYNYPNYSTYTPQYTSQTVNPNYTNPYYSSTSDNNTIVTDSQNPMYTSMSQANINSSTHQYQGYTDPYAMQQVGPIPEAVSTVSAYSAGNQVDLNASFAQMQVSVPKTETFNQDYSQTFYSMQYPQAITPNLASYSHAPVTSNTTIVSSDNSDYYNQYGQQNPSIPSYNVSEPQYEYSSSNMYEAQNYPIYTNADKSAYSTTTFTSLQSNTSLPYSYSTEGDKAIDPIALAQLEALDKPIKSHVTGQALSTNFGYQNYQKYDPNVNNYAPTEQAQPVDVSYNQTDGNYVQTYQNHPGYTYNMSTGNYDYNYGSQNSYTNHPSQLNVVPESMAKDQNWVGPGVYTNAGVCNTVQSPSENPQTPSESGNDQTYYNMPYGYQTHVIQSNEVAPDQQSTTTNYGANINQSTYMQSGHAQENVTYSNNSQVSTVENVEENNETVSEQETKLETPPPEPKSEEIKTEPVVELSTFDLLSDIDFSVEQTPLTPQIKVPQVSESAIRKPIAIKPEPIKPVIKEEVLERPPKKDLFTDPSLLNQFTQEVKILQRLVDTLTEKTPSGLTVLDSKWKTIQEVHTKENSSRSKAIAMKHCKRSIVSEFVPYDDSRLILKSNPNAYINASYYKQLASWCIPLVISNPPAESEYSTFWRAMLENNISCVVCLQTEIEMQSRVYWPTAMGTSLEFPGDLKVTLDEVTCTVNWTERILTVMSGNNVLKATHFQINVFPAKIACAPLVMLAHRVAGSGPVWIVGAGRAALLALVVAALCQVRAGQLHLVDMLDQGCVNLYKHRTNVLEDTRYLADAYRTVLFYAQGVLCSGTIMFNGEAVTAATGASLLPPLTAAPPKCKFSKESFEEMRQAPGLKSGDMKDPLNFLDPLWSLKKK